MIKYVDPLLTQKACCFSARLLTRKEKTKQTSTLRETPACETIHSVHPNRLPVNHHASPALAASEERSPRCHRLWPHTIVDSAGSGANTCHMAGNSLDQQAASMDSPHQLLDMIQTCSNLNKANLGPWILSKRNTRLSFSPAADTATYGNRTRLSALKWPASLCNGHCPACWTLCLDQPCRQIQGSSQWCPPSHYLGESLETTLW